MSATGTPAPPGVSHSPKGVNLVISRKDRDALHTALLVSFTGLSDIRSCLVNGEIADAQRRRVRFERELRLLDDLGWDPEPDTDRFTLTMPAENLAPILERIYWESAGALADPEVIADNSVVDPRKLVLTCSSLLARLTAFQSDAGVDDDR